MPRISNSGLLRAKLAMLQARYDYGACSGSIYKVIKELQSGKSLGWNTASCPLIAASSKPTGPWDSSVGISLGADRPGMAGDHARSP